jgi:hypothetical protein
VSKTIPWRRQNKIKERNEMRRIKKGVKTDEVKWALQKTN